MLGSFCLVKHRKNQPEIRQEKIVIRNKTTTILVMKEFPREKILLSEASFTFILPIK